MFQSRDSSPSPSLTVSDTDASVDSGISYEISSANLTNQIEASLRTLVIRCHIVIFICYALMTLYICSHSGESCFDNMIAMHAIHVGVVAYVIFIYAKQSHINAYHILEKKLICFEYFFAQGNTSTNKSNKLQQKECTSDHNDSIWDEFGMSFR